MDKKYISIGFQCLPSICLDELGMKQETLPFDWLLTNPKFILKILTDLLSSENEIESIVRSTFLKCKHTAFFGGTMEHYTILKSDIDINSENNFIWNEYFYNRNYDVIFPHDKPNDDIFSKYIRRFERLKEIINSDNELLFIWISESSKDLGSYRIDDKIIINDDEVVSQLYDIEKLLSDNHSNFKILIIDAIGYNIIPNKNILHKKINSGNNWGDIKEESKKIILEQK
jgi:hypothetical protein